MKIPRRYRATLQKYRKFVEDGWPQAKLDWSEEAALALFRYESYGHGPEEGNVVTGDNGYMSGKKWCDWQVENWRDGLKSGLIHRDELLADPALEFLSREVNSAIESVFGKRP